VSPSQGRSSTIRVKFATAPGAVSSDWIVYTVACIHLAEALPGLNVLDERSMVESTRSTDVEPLVTETKELMTFAPESSGLKIDDRRARRQFPGLDDVVLGDLEGERVLIGRTDERLLGWSRRRSARKQGSLARDRCWRWPAQLVADQATQPHRRLPESHGGDVIFAATRFTMKARVAVDHATTSTRTIPKLFARKSFQFCGHRARTRCKSASLWLW
jgi:hypothetical protein